MMAIPQDYQKYKQLWPAWAARCNIHPTDGRILMCSPNAAQYRLIQTICPSAHLMQRTRVEWDMNQPWREDPVDIIIACNVFFYSPNPDLWFRNCFRACRYLWIQDLMVRPRGPDGLEFSTIDRGDYCRYRFGDNFQPTRFHTFDLLIYSGKLLDFELYDAGSFENRKTLINFMAMFRGDIE